MKKVFLCILDGFGLGDPNYKYNAVFKSNIPNIKRFLKDYPHSLLQTSGESVGLPKGQMGNSEVGHMTIGSGRVLMQDLPLISKAIETGEIWKKDLIKEALFELKQNRGALHLLGLCSNGGVHSHLDHIHKIANFFDDNGVKVFIHAISDGRDVQPKNFLDNLNNFENGFNKNVKIVSLCGRFFTMDRDNNTERTEKGINVALKADGKRFQTLKEAIEDSYQNNITDEFIEPCVIGDYYGADKSDIIFYANFRADRARQGLQAILDNCLFKKVYSMMHYSDALTKLAKPLFAKEDLTNTLSEVISKAGMHQFKIAETEKYAHITFFFNGGKEDILPKEERLIVPSPDVATYDLKPEMSLPQVEENLLEKLSQNKFEFVACNIANGDMVGHTGDFEASKKAAERIDEFLGKMEAVCLKNDYVMLVTADHGNLEEMLDSNGIKHTQHTTQPVPLFIVSNQKYNIKDGSLANIAPTILKLLDITKPQEMEDALI